MWLYVTKINMNVFSFLNVRMENFILYIWLALVAYVLFQLDSASLEGGYRDREEKL